MTIWVRSTRCNSGYCVEAAWVKSSASGAGECVEAHLVGDSVHVRDSKDPAGPVIFYPAEWWQTRCEAMREAAKRGDERWLPSGVGRTGYGVTWHSHGKTQRYTREEWEAFRDGVLAGEFDVDVLAADGPLSAAFPVGDTQHHQPGSTDAPSAEVAGARGVVGEAQDSGESP